MGKDREPKRLGRLATFAGGGVLATLAIVACSRGGSSETQKTETPAQTPVATQEVTPSPTLNPVVETPTTTPEPTPEIYKYQEALDSLAQVRGFLDPEKNTNLDERLAQYGIDLSEGNDIRYYSVRKQMILEMLEGVEEEIRSERLVGADFQMRRGVALLEVPLKINGDKFAVEQSFITTEEGAKLDPENKLGLQHPSGKLAISDLLRPALEKFIEARYKLPN